MKRVLALAIFGLVVGGCGGDAPEQNSPPPSNDARRQHLHDHIKASTPFKFVAWECVLPGVEVKHVSLREDSLFVEVIEKTGDRRGKPAVYRVSTQRGTPEWVVELPDALDFRPGIVGSVVRTLATLAKERDKLIADREVERNLKNRNMEKIAQLTDSIRQKTDLIEAMKLMDRVYAVSSRDNLHVIERPAGQEFERVRLRFTPSTAAAASSTIVFIGAEERNRLIGLDPNTWAETVYFAADAAIRTTPIYADPGNVYFASEDGHVYGYTADGRSKLIDYATEDAIVCDLCLDIEVDEKGKETWGALFAASTDYALYCFNRISGEMIWKYETGAQLRTTPQVSGGVAYCFARDKGMHAIDKRTGKLLYIKKDAWFPLCRGKDRIYLAGPKADSVIAVEERTGKELGRSSIDMFSHVVSDPRGRLVYLVTGDGYMYAAKESEVDY
jgi:outer membrane protein assembly factor BamB